jgi:hypothetical protein
MTDQHTIASDEHLSFESLPGELSAEQVNLPIESSMKKLVEFFEADHCHLGKLSDDQSKIIVPFLFLSSNFLDARFK